MSCHHPRPVFRLLFPDPQTVVPRLYMSLSDPLHCGKIRRIADNHRRHTVISLFLYGLYVRLNQKLSFLHLFPRFRFDLKMLSLQLYRIQTNMNQDFHSLAGCKNHRMAGGENSTHLPVRRRKNLSVQRLKGDSATAADRNALRRAAAADDVRARLTAFARSYTLEQLAEARRVREDTTRSVKERTDYQNRLYFSLEQRIRQEVARAVPPASPEHDACLSAAIAVMAQTMRAYNLKHPPVITDGAE